VAILEHRLGDDVTQSVDDLVPIAHMIIGQQMVPAIILSSAIYGPIAGLLAI
jgi:hypothetical protein